MCLDACGLVRIEYNPEIHDYEVYKFFTNVQKITGAALAMLATLGFLINKQINDGMTTAISFFLYFSGAVILSCPPARNFGTVLKVIGVALGIIGAIGAGFLFVPGRLALGLCSVGLILGGFGLIGLGEDFRQHMTPPARGRA